MFALFCFLETLRVFQEKCLQKTTNGGVCFTNSGKDVFHNTKLFKKIPSLLLFRRSYVRVLEGVALLWKVERRGGEGKRGRGLK